MTSKKQEQPANSERKDRRRKATASDECRVTSAPEITMSKYDPLYKWLSGLSDKMVSVTFREIEKVLGCGLPPTARKDPAWWANENNIQSRHVQCNAWLDAGFRVEKLSISKETLDFVLSLPRK